MSFTFMGFDFFISSLVIFYRDDYIHCDLNISRFILMVLLFVLSIIFLIIRPNMISILLVSHSTSVPPGFPGPS
jgi:NADH-ubiquinone oxidoreductase chain 5